MSFWVSKEHLLDRIKKLVEIALRKEASLGLGPNQLFIHGNLKVASESRVTPPIVCKLLCAEGFIQL